MMGRVLIVEDVPEMSELMRTYFEIEGLTVLEAGTAELAEATLKTQTVDLIVLDLNLPGMDGFQFLERLRTVNTVPVIIVSARDDDGDVISALGIGADEYLTKPFSPRTLAARVRAMIRRTKGYAHREDAALVRFGAFELDLDSGILKKGGERVPLTPKEFSVLSYLVLSEGVHKTPEEIYDSVWGRKYGDYSEIGVYIRRLRLKIEQDPAAPRFLLTERGFGYRFENSTPPDTP